MLNWLEILFYTTPDKNDRSLTRLSFSDASIEIIDVYANIMKRKVNRRKQ